MGLTGALERGHRCACRRDHCSLDLPRPQLPFPSVRHQFVRTIDDASPPGLLCAALKATARHAAAAEKLDHDTPPKPNPHREICSAFPLTVPRSRVVAFHRDGTVSGKRGSHDTLTTAQTGVPDEPATPSPPTPREGQSGAAHTHALCHQTRLLDDSNCAHSGCDSRHTIGHTVHMQ
jgi:hypothetical protein